MQKSDQTRCFVCLGKSIYEYGVIEAHHPTWGGIEIVANLIGVHNRRIWVLLETNREVVPRLAHGIAFLTQDFVDITNVVEIPRFAAQRSSLACTSSRVIRYLPGGSA